MNKSKATGPDQVCNRLLIAALLRLLNLFDSRIRFELFCKVLHVIANGVLAQRCHYTQFHDVWLWYGLQWVLLRLTRLLHLKTQNKHKWTLAHSNYVINTYIYNETLSVWIVIVLIMDPSQHVVLLTAKYQKQGVVHWNSVLAYSASDPVLCGKFWLTSLGKSSEKAPSTVSRQCYVFTQCSGNFMSPQTVDLCSNWKLFSHYDYELSQQ